MSDTEIEETEETENVPEEDTTELELRTWGLSGQPSSWALSTWSHVIDTIRMANRGETDAAAVQAELDATFPDAGYTAAEVMLAHPPTGEFDLEVTGELSVHVVTPPDEDLDLPADNMQWEWGDGSTEFDAGCPDHDYAAPGAYDVRLYVTVAGARYGSGQMVEVGGSSEPVGQGITNPAVLERPAMVFTDPDELATQIEAEQQAQAAALEAKEADEPVEEDAEEGPYDPAAHTVDEVLAYVAEHPDEAEEIAAAEEQGKARVGILDHI